MLIWIIYAELKGNTGVIFRDLLIYIDDSLNFYDKVDT